MAPLASARSVSIVAASRSSVSNNAERLRPNFVVCASGSTPIATKMSEREIPERTLAGVIAVHRTHEPPCFVVPASRCRELIEKLVGELHVQEGQISESDRCAPGNAGLSFEGEVVDERSDLFDREERFSKPWVREQGVGKQLANPSSTHPVERQHRAVPNEVAALLRLISQRPSAGSESRASAPRRASRWRSSPWSTAALRGSAGAGWRRSVVS